MEVYDFPTPLKAFELQYQLELTHHLQAGTNRYKNKNRLNKEKRDSDLKKKSYEGIKTEKICKRKKQRH